VDVEELKKRVVSPDGKIELGEPLVIEKYGKQLTIRQVNFCTEWEPLVFNLGIFLMYYHQTLESAALPSTADDLTDFRDNMRTALRVIGVVNRKHQNDAFNALLNICEFTGVKAKWMKKHFTIDDYVEVFVLVYLYNVMGKKKTLSDALRLIGTVQSHYLKPWLLSTFGSKKNTASPRKSLSA
jgi:hypothetical protein